MVPYSKIIGIIIKLVYATAKQDMERIMATNTKMQRQHLLLLTSPMKPIMPTKSRAPPIANMAYPPGLNDGIYRAGRILSFHRIYRNLSKMKTILGSSAWY
jgi:hypothetical protein